MLCPVDHCSRRDVPVRSACAGLVVATHTLLVVKCFSIALVLALAMRTAFKYVPEDPDVVVATEMIKQGGVPGFKRE